MINKMERKEVEMALYAQNLKGLMGVGNICPGCKHNGGFGSISRYRTLWSNEYYLCSHCKKYFKIKNEKRK